MTHPKEDGFSITHRELAASIERLTKLVENEDAHWNLVGPSSYDCVDVLVSDLRTILQALAVIPTQGLGSSSPKSEDTHRVAETAVVVPKEPTEAMLEAGCRGAQDGVGCTPWNDSSHDRDHGVGRGLVRDYIARAYRAMLAAAPSSDTAGEGT